VTARHTFLSGAALLALLAGCAAPGPGIRLVTGRQPEGTVSPTAPGATLLCRLTDTRGRPVALAWFELPELHHAAMTDETGAAKFPPLPAGPWLVRWHVTGIPDGDSTRVRFEAGSAETLEVRVRLPGEAWKREAGGAPAPPAPTTTKKKR